MLRRPQGREERKGALLRSQAPGAKPGRCLTSQDSIYNASRSLPPQPRWQPEPSSALSRCPFVLASLVLVLAARPQAASGRLDEDRTQRVKEVLLSAGYALETYGPGLREGTVSRGAQNARVYILADRKDASARFGEGTAILQLTMEFDVARQLPLVALQRGLDLLPPGETLFLPNLGGTVEAIADVVLGRKATPEGTKRRLDGYFAAVEAYARAHGGADGPPPPRDWRREPLDDASLLNRPDLTSLHRLFQG